MSKTTTQSALELDQSAPPTVLAKQETAVQRQSTSTLDTLAALANHPNALQNIEALERLLAMQERVLSDQRRAEFNEALSRVQAQMKPIEQHGAIAYEGKNGKPPTRIPYAKLEDIDRVVRPIYSAEGFSVVWNTKPILDGKLIEITGNFRHKSGHEESLSLALGPDDSGGKNNVQSRASTVAYGKRHILKMFLHIIELGADIDGADLKTLTVDQVDTIRSLREEVKANGPRFLKLMDVEKLEDIKQRDYEKAVNILRGMK